MRSIQTTVAAACAALALTAGAATAQTVPPDRTTYVTFSGPVSVPGTTLPAGTYTFKLLNSDTNRNVVQIFNREGTKLMTTLLAVPAQRNEPTGDPIITFKETPSDRPPAVHYWYYAGDVAGNELVYPKNQAMLIASASGESVMSVDSTGNSIDDWKSGSMSRVNPDHADQAQAGSQTSTSTSASSTSSSTSTTTAADAMSSQRPSAAQSSASQSQTAQPTTTAEQTPQQPTTPTTAQPTTTTADQPAPPTTAPATTPPSAAMDQTAQPSTPAPTTAPTTPPSTPSTVGTSGRTESLPHTASELPMVGLIGLLALSGALALRAVRTA